MTARKPSSANLRFGHPLAQGLIGAWFFTEGYGNVPTNGGGPFSLIPVARDSSGQNNPGGQDQNPFTTPPIWVGGPYGWASQPVTASNANMWRMTYSGQSTPLDLTSGAFSIVALFNTTTGNNGTGDGELIGTNNNSTGWYFGHRSATTRWRFFSNDGGIGIVTNPITYNIWNHIVLSQDASGNYQWYVNGIADNSGTGAAQPKAGVGCQIGASSGNGSSGQFEGTFDHILIYNRTLSENEVAQLYYNPYEMIRPRSIGFRSTNQILTPQIWM